jgi:hypothetical protein
MTRKTIDCRLAPSESGCTLTISGEEDEVLDAAVHHAVTVHAHPAEPTLREELRSVLLEETGPSTEGAFVQLIEFETDRPEELDGIQDRAVAAMGDERTTRWSVIGADRNQDGSYVMVVEFPGHADAVANSALPATAEFAEQLAKICTSGPSFRDLDVRRVRPY